MNRELPDVQASFRKGRGTRDQIANILWIMEKAREFQKNIYFCFIDYAKTFDSVDHHTLWEILKDMGIQDHLTCLLRNLYACQEATVRTGRGTTEQQQNNVVSNWERSMSRLYIVTLKAMAPHSSTLAWKTPWTEEPGGLQFMGSLKSQTRLSDFTFTFHFHALEKEMATHSSVLAWRIPGTGEPGGLLSVGPHRVEHD